MICPEVQVGIEPRCLVPAELVFRDGEVLQEVVGEKVGGKCLCVIHRGDSPDGQLGVKRVISFTVVSLDGRQSVKELGQVVADSRQVVR